MSSIIKVDTIQLADGTAGTIENLGLATGALSHRNLIHNGDMRIAQRGTSGSISSSSSGYKSVDRFRANVTNSTCVFNFSKDTDAPAGFSNSLKVVPTTADSSVGASDRADLQQKIEGQNLQHLNYGTSSAKDLTISFWVKSNVTGTYGFAVYGYDQADRNTYSTSYNISSSGTWEYKTITIPGDTNGNIDNDNGGALGFIWGLMSGSDFTGGTTDAWSSYLDDNSVFLAAHNVNVMSSTSNYWQITGVQLEVGSVATPFEHISYGEELARCQRYYEIIEQNDTYGGDGYNYITTGVINTASNFYGVWQFNTTKRTIPTMGASSGAKFFLAGSSTAENKEINEWYSPGLQVARLRVPAYSDSGGAAMCSFDKTNCSNAWIYADAEL